MLSGLLREETCLSYTCTLPCSCAAAWGVVPGMYVKPSRLELHQFQKGQMKEAEKQLIGGALASSRCCQRTQKQAVWVVGWSPAGRRPAGGPGRAQGHHCWPFSGRRNSCRAFQEVSPICRFNRPRKSLPQKKTEKI